MTAILFHSITPSPLLLIYHFFSVALYSIYILFTAPRFSVNPSANGDLKKGVVPGFSSYPALTIKSVEVFWAAVVVLLPVLWNEGQM